LQYQTETFFIVFPLGVNQYTIDEHYDELVQIFDKYLVHEIHIAGRGIS
jgi:hypothetical protein